MENSAGIRIQPTILSKFTDVAFLSDIGNILLFKEDAGVLEDGEFYKFISKFLKSLEYDIKSGIISLPTSPVRILGIIDLLKQINMMKEDINASLVHYDNVLFHLSEFLKKNKHLQSFIDEILNNRIISIDEFRSKLDDAVKTIKLYNDIKLIRPSLDKLDGFIFKCQSENSTPYEIISDFKKVVLEMSASISNIKSIQDDELDDYIIVNPSDETCADQITEKLVAFLSEGYSFSKSGYELIDATIGGIESNTIHIVSGPTNHGKSIFLLNLCRSLALNYVVEDNNKKNAIVFVTLEDDIYRLLRRYFCIFGNYDSTVIREFFVRLSAKLKNKKYKDIKDSIVSNMIKKIYNKCVGQIENVSIIFKHSFEDMFSPRDAATFLNELELKGYNIIALFIDYLDVMIPTYMYSNNKDDYNAQGQIVHELKKLCKQFKIPIITATQNKRESENTTRSLDNEQVGDSYKKVRYSDFVYMIRKRDDLDLFNDTVSKDIKNCDILPNVNVLDPRESSQYQFIEYLVPFEVKITKSKDGAKGVKKYHIFNTRNLRIYDDLAESMKDLQDMAEVSNELMSLMSNMDDLSESTIMGIDLLESMISKDLLI